MLPKMFLVFVALAIATLAAPLNNSSSLDKRAQPVITPGVYTTQQGQQLVQAHRDAINMASMVVTASNHPAWFDSIFRKYFDINDKSTIVGKCPPQAIASRITNHVPAVFRRIVDRDDGQGHSLLGDIKFVADFFKEDEDDPGLTCDDDSQSELRDYETNNPRLIVCPNTFERGAIGRSWPGAPGVICNTCYPRISYRMETLGHALLHEYTHWNKLMSPVTQVPFLIRAATDQINGYGPWKVRQLSGRVARKNADSYAWLATEVWFTRSCARSHGALQEPTERDN